MPIRNGSGNGMFEVKKWFMGLLAGFILLMVIPTISFISKVGGNSATFNNIARQTLDNENKIKNIEEFRIKYETKIEIYDNLFTGIEAGFKEQRGQWNALETFMARQDERLKAIERKLK